MSHHSSSSSNSSSSSGEFPQYYGPNEYSAPVYYQPHGNTNPQLYANGGRSHWQTQRLPASLHQAQSQQMYAEMPSAHNNSHTGYNQLIVPAHAPTLRTRYPQPPMHYSNLYNELPSYGGLKGHGVKPSFFSSFGGYSPFNSGNGHNSGRSNCHSPTYDMGLSEVLPTRAPGSSVLCLEQRRSSSSSWRTFLCNLKLKHITCVLLVLILLMYLTTAMLEKQLNFEFEAYQFVKSADQRKAKMEHLESAGDASENWPHKGNTVHSSDEFQNEATNPDTESQILRPVGVEKMRGEGYPKVIYSFDDANDDEAFIELEDVIV